MTILNNIARSRSKGCSFNKLIPAQACIVTILGRPLVAIFSNVAVFLAFETPKLATHSLTVTRDTAVKILHLRKPFKVMC